MSEVKKIAAGLTFLMVLGVISVGCMLLALWLAVKMVQPMPVEHATAVLKPVSTLEVVNNYNEQKTAPINVLEPKVSDAYLQGAYNESK